MVQISYRILHVLCTQEIFLVKGWAELTDERLRTWIRMKLVEETETKKNCTAVYSIVIARIIPAATPKRKLTRFCTPREPANYLGFGSQGTQRHQSYEIIRQRSAAYSAF